MNAPKSIFQELVDIEGHRALTVSTGIPALQRLANVALRDSGQARTVGLFLLGLYNGHTYPFSLTQLRGLDLDLHSDCLAVLRLDYHPAREVHQYIEGGDELFKQLRDRLTEKE